MTISENLREELGRLMSQKKSCEDELAILDEETERLQEEIELARQHVTYYTKLTHDMKKELKPSKFSSVLKKM